METPTGSTLNADLKSAHSSPFRKQIWAIGGGKGGVGKSLISSSIAYMLAKLGHSTIAIDLDLGGANLHTVLGQAPPQKCLSDYLSRKTNSLSQCITDTAFPNLKIIGGAKDDLTITQISDAVKKDLLDQIRQLDAQFVIMDLGAGTSHYTLDFFNAADVGIMSVLPEPTSIENAYRFLKASYYTRIYKEPAFESIRNMVEAAMTPNNAMGIQSPTDLLNEVNYQNPQLAIQLRDFIRACKPKLILNQTRTQTDIDVGFSIKSVAKKYFGIDIDYLGYLEYEPNVWQSVRRMRPLLADYPQSRIASHMERICHYLLKQARTDLQEKQIKHESF